MVAEVESFMNFVHVLNVNRRFTLSYDGPRMHCLNKIQFALCQSTEELLSHLSCHVLPEVVMYNARM